MKIMVDISEQDYVYIAKKHCLPSCDDRTLRKAFYEMIAKGTPLDEIKDEIEQIEINGHIKEKDVECFRAGINTALNVINKYNAEVEPQERSEKERIKKVESDVEKRKPCINYDDGCEEWAGCPCVYYETESEDKK